MCENRNCQKKNLILKKVEYSLCSVTVSFQKMKYAPYNNVAHILTSNHFYLFCFVMVCYQVQIVMKINVMSKICSKNKKYLWNKFLLI